MSDKFPSVIAVVTPSSEKYSFVKFADCVTSVTRYRITIGATSNFAISRWT